jgi:WD40 repeat protein
MRVERVLMTRHHRDVSLRHRQELSGLLAALGQGDVGPKEVLRALTGPRQLWWNCCREAVRDDPSWLFGQQAQDLLEQIEAWSAPAQSRPGPIVAMAAATLAVCRALSVGAPAASSDSARSDVEAGARDRLLTSLRQALSQWDRVHAAPPTPAGGAVCTDPLLLAVDPRLEPGVDVLIRHLQQIATGPSMVLVALTAQLLATSRAHRQGMIRMPVVFGQRGGTQRGLAGTLEVHVLPGGPAGLFPDPRFMGVLEADSSFWESLSTAWRLAGRDHTSCVLWRIALDNGAAVPSIDGNSLGAAFAIVLRELRRPARTPVGRWARRIFRGRRPGIAVTGGVNSAGALVRVGHMAGKLEAAATRRLRLIAPAANSPDIGGAHHPDTVLFAETIKQAERYARRWRTGRLAAAVLLLVAPAATGASAYLYAERSTARASLSRVAAAQARELLETQPGLARQLAAAAYRVSPTPQALGSLLEASTAAGEISVPGDVLATHFLPAGDLLIATADAIFATRLGSHGLSRLDQAISGKITDIAVSGDGRMMAVSTAQGTVEVWSLANFPRSTLVGRAHHPGHGAGSVVFSADARFLAASFAPAGLLMRTGDFAVRLWDVSLGAPVEVWRQFLPDQPGLAPLLFSPAGMLMVGGTQLYAIDTGTAFRRREITTPRDQPVNGLLRGYNIRPLSFSPDGSTLSTIDTQLGLLLWYVAEPGREQHYRPSDIAHDATFSPADNTMATWDTNGRGPILVRARPAQIGTQHTFMFDPVSSCLSRSGPLSGSFAFGPDGRNLVASTGSTVRFWQIEPSCPAEVSVLPEPGEAQAVDAAGRRAATIDFWAEVRLWDVTNPPQPRLLSAPPKPKRPGSDNGRSSVAVAPSGTIVVTAGRDNWIRLWKARDENLTLHSEIPNPTTAVADLAISADERWLAIAHERLTLFDLRNPQPLDHPVTLSTGDITADMVAFDPAGDHVLVGSGNGHIRIWDLTDANAERSRSLRSPFDVRDMAISADGRSVAAVGEALVIWDLDQRGALPTRVYDNVEGFGLAYTPDGDYLVTSHTDGAQLWDLRDSAPVRVGRLPGSNGAGAVSPFRDTKIVALTDSMWSYDAETFLSHICRTTGDVITLEQWRDYLPTQPYEPPCR